MTRPLLALLLAAPLAAAQTPAKFDGTDAKGFDRLFVHTWGNVNGRTAETTADGGVRFAIPRRKESGHLVRRCDVRIPGPFQVEAKYEVEQFPPAVTEGYGVAFGIYANPTDEGTAGGATINRGLMANVGHRYHIGRNLPLGNGKTHYATSGTPAPSRAGRMALRRIGTEIIALAADTPDGELVEQYRFPYSDKPIANIGLYADTGGALAEFKGRLYDVKIRTGADVPTDPPKKGPRATVLSDLPTKDEIAAAAAPAPSKRVVTVDPPAGGPGDAAMPSTAEVTAPAAARGGWWLPVVTGVVGLAVGVVVGRASAGRKDDAEGD